MYNNLLLFADSKCFFSIYIFRTLIMTIDGDRILKNLDNSTDDYNGHIQKIMILQVIQQIFCEMLIGGKQNVNSDDICLINNTRTNIQEILQSLKR